MSFFVYIIECSNKFLYTGITNDLKRRFLQHQTGRGGHYTSYNPAIRLRYFEKHNSRSQAAKREAQIKGWSRTKKLALIKGDGGFLKAFKVKKQADRYRKLVLRRGGLASARRSLS